MRILNKSEETRIAQSFQTQKI